MALFSDFASPARPLRAGCIRYDGLVLWLIGFSSVSVLTHPRGSLLTRLGAAALVAICSAVVLPGQGESIAFVGVAVVPMDSPRVLRDQVVLVRDGKILRVGPTGTVTIPGDARRIDGRKRYLIPGLADMHMHFVGPEHYADISLLFVANGVTTVRCMWGTPEVLQFARRSQTDPWVPTISTTGPPTGGAPPIYPGMRVVKTPEEARRAVADDRAAGYDAIKVYNRLPAPAYRALVQASGAIGLPVVGHVPEDVTLDDALTSGQKSIEHLQGYVRAVTQNSASSLPDKGTPADAGRLKAVVSRTKQHGVYNTPTLVVYGNLLEGLRDPSAVPVEFRFVSPSLRAAWDVMLARWTPILSGDGAREYRDTQKLLMHITMALDEGGAPLLLGTDAPNPYVVPGFSVHDELEALVHAGLTPYRALRTATVSTAAFIGRSDTGTIAAGHVADLVLLTANPLDDIRATRQRDGVMIRGRWLPAADLRLRLDRLAKRFEAQP